MKKYIENGLEILYQVKEDGIEICHVRCKDTLIALPVSIDGCPVKGLASKAFVQEEGQGEESPIVEILLPDTIEWIEKGAFSYCKNLRQITLPRALRVVSNSLFEGCTKLSKVVISEQICCIGEYAFHNCKNLQEVILPDSVTSIEKYAFYNCFGLKKLRLPAGLKELGMGAFKNCDILDTILLGGHTFMQSIVADFSQAFTFEIEYSNKRKAVLLFPDFVYEYVEDYPARQFHQVNYGSGHFYRQCISNIGIDYRRYDELFRIAVREETREIATTIAVNRLAYPYQLQEDKKQGYLFYLKENAVAAAQLFLKKGEIKKLEAICTWGVLTQDAIDIVIELAGKMQKTEYVSFLLDYKHNHFTIKEKQFEL